MKIFRTVYYILVLLFLLDVFELFQTKIELIKILTFYSVIILTIPFLILEFKNKLKGYLRIISISLPIALILLIFYINPLKLIFHIQPWKTQIINHINVNDSNHKVETQMKGIGAPGYLKRQAEIYYLSDYFFIILSTKIDTNKYKTDDWKKINQDIYEIEFK